MPNWNVAFKVPTDGCHRKFPHYQCISHSQLERKIVSLRFYSPLFGREPTFASHLNEEQLSDWNSRELLSALSIWFQRRALIYIFFLLNLAKRRRRLNRDAHEMRFRFRRSRDFRFSFAVWFLCWFSFSFFLFFCALLIMSWVMESGLRSRVKDIL